MEDRAGGRTNRLGVVDVDRGAGEHDARRAGGVRRTEDRARVPRIPNLMEHGDASWFAVDEILDRPLEVRRDPDDPWGVTVDVSARITSGLTWTTSTPRSDARTASGWRGSSTIRSGCRGLTLEGFADGLRALDEEGSCVIAERSLLQPQDGRDLRILEAGEHAHSPAGLRSCGVYEGPARAGPAVGCQEAGADEASFTDATSEANAAGSCTARSARPSDRPRRPAPSAH
jgi:hypothetical protein